MAGLSVVTDVQVNIRADDADQHHQGQHLDPAPVLSHRGNQSSLRPVIINAQRSRDRVAA